MTPAANGRHRGVVYTFYSFKGGVGRTMALVNVAALLAKWGHSVLAVDWDLEAPGLERFFARITPEIQELRANKPGVLDLVQARKDGGSLPWRDCLIALDFENGPSRLSLISAGRSGPDYITRLQSLDFPELFEKQDLGRYIETLRNEWTSDFDFVLVDSRTGVTDIGGICTIHLADVLILLFTTTESSVDGAMQVMERARKAQEHLPIDRRRLLALPVPARDESRTEYERAAQWKNRFAEQFSELYRDWLPGGRTAHDAVELLRIPYIPYWSFGEPLPVIEEGTTDPAGIGHAYEILARLISTRLDWYAALEGQTLAPLPLPKRRELDRDWLARHRKAAFEGLAAAGFSGFMEVWHFTPDSYIEKHQPELLRAARGAQVYTEEWPIGIVVDNIPESRPQSRNEGITAEVSRKSLLFDAHGFAYWTLTKGGDFYTLWSLHEDHREDQRERGTIWYDLRIERASEALLHCVILYKLQGIAPSAHIDLGARYGGLQGRILAAYSQNRIDPNHRNLHEGEAPIPPVTFRLGALDTEMVGLVKKLCEPLFVVFDYASFPDDVYQRIVADFVRGRLRA